MARNNGILKKIREGIEKWGTMPDGSPTPKAKLARIIYKDDPLSFVSAENVRLTIQRITGKAGEGSKASVMDKSLFETEERPKNPYGLPESDAESYDPYNLVAKRTLILNDLHFPFHEHKPITAALDYAKGREFDAILLNGDVMDFHGLSRFEKDPKKKRFHEELNVFREFMEILDREFPKAKKYYKLGNHCERYEHFLWMKAKELDGVEEFKFENILQARAKGITVISDKRIILFNDFAVMHGHEFAGSGYSPINPARSLFNRAVRDAAQGHNHQSSETIKVALGGKEIITYSMGCLCGLNPRWLPNNNWNWGFGDMECDISGTEYVFQNKRISKNGKII